MNSNPSNRTGLAQKTRRGEETRQARLKAGRTFHRQAEMARMDGGRSNLLKRGLGTRRPLRSADFILRTSLLLSMFAHATGHPP